MLERRLEPLVLALVAEALFFVVVTERSAVGLFAVITEGLLAVGVTVRALARLLVLASAIGLLAGLSVTATEGSMARLLVLATAEGLLAGLFVTATVRLLFVAAAVRLFLTVLLVIRRAEAAVFFRLVVLEISELLV
ncbi:hypothetical protein [Glutamicibacter sp. AOP5-A2-18]|uniref:hypothetical protein n=1 Tax=Glutamicibacter sp. AOP5-A2-18 TaxID=3457656 RepID=UPI0040333BEE